MNNANKSTALMKGARIWTFDGGGPGVISQLLIVNEIMHQIQWSVKLEEVPRPCDYAELMMGSGLGAVTVILLARLRLTAEEALSHITKFGQNVFAEPDDSTNGRRLSLERLIIATRNILYECGLSADTKMVEDVITSGQTYAAVTAVPTSNLAVCRLLRTYRGSLRDHDCSILDSILVTMALPEWLSPVTIGSGYSEEEMISGSAGFNNPTKKALEEAEYIFGSDQLISVVISLGSEQRRTHTLTEHNTKELQQALSAMAQEDGSVMDDLAQQFGNALFYHRFSVNSGIKPHNMTVWDNPEISAITSHTKTYADRNMSALTAVAELLVENKGSHTIQQLTQVRSKIPVARPVPRLSPYYVPREEVYDFMDQRLVRDHYDDQRLFVIYGMGGVGKTQLTSYFYRKNRDRYKYIFFINASSAESIKADLQGATRSLGGSHSQDTFEDALQFLARPDNQDWLVIFDNADDPELQLAMYLPDCEHGTVIITSRNHALAELAPTSNWHLQSMDEPDSLQVLLKATKRKSFGSDEESITAAEICRLLGGLPLALVQVGCYCHTTKITFSQYLERFQMYRSKLMEMQLPLQLDKYSYSTYTSIGLSYSLLDERARDLLHLLAFFHPLGISLEILRVASKYEFRVYQDAELLPRDNEYSQRLNVLQQLLIPDGSWSDIYIDTLLNQLQSFSLVSLSLSNDQTNITIHPLIQSCILDTLKAEAYSLYSYMTVLVLSGCSRYEELALFQHLPTHIAELESRKVDVHPNELSSFAYILLQNGNYEKAMEIGEKVRDECKKRHGEDHRTTLRMSYWTAECLYKMSKGKEAEKIISHLVRKQEMILREDDDDLFDSYQLLAKILIEQYRTEEAENILQRRLILSQSKYGQDHQKTLEIQSALASNLFYQGQYSEAEVLSRRVLPSMKKKLGEDDFVTLNTLNTLSSALMEQEKWAEAEDILAEEVIKHKMKYGKHHIETLFYLYTLACCLIRRDKLDEAERILREVLEVRVKSLGNRHQQTIETREALGRIARLKKIVDTTNNPPPNSPKPVYPSLPADSGSRGSAFKPKRRSNVFKNIWKFFQRK